MNKNQKKYSTGFTLIEIMVVVVILAILAAVVVPKILSRPEQARVVAVKQEIQQIQNALGLYKLDNGFYPTTEQGISALITKPKIAPIPENYAADAYLPRMPVDPWGHSYHYANPGKHASMDLWSDGPSQDPTKPSVIGNWQIT